ncbi:hypothetical protein QN239_31175 [Mycolicibacterium sp. Y3]
MRLSERRRLLIGSAWIFSCLFGNAAVRLRHHGYDRWTWWLLFAGVCAAISLLLSWTLARYGRLALARHRQALAGLDDHQCRQVARVWRRHEPIPTDAAVLVAALSLHALSERQRLRTWRARTIFAVLYAASSCLAYFATDHRLAIALTMWFIAALMMSPEIHARLRRPRLALLRAAAQDDPGVTAAIDTITSPPAARPRRNVWMLIAAALISLGYFASFAVAVHFSPKERGCHAWRSIVNDGDSEFIWTSNIGPGGPPLADYQQWVQRLHTYASDAGDDPDTAPRIRRIVDLADQAVEVVGRTRQPDFDTRPEMLIGPQTHYVDLLKSFVGELDSMTRLCTS